MKKRNKYTYEDVKKYIESFGYELLSKEYKNNSTKLLVRCPFGHEPYEVTFHNFKDRKSRCPYCSKKHHYTYNEVKEYLEKEGYELLDNYKTCMDKLKTICPNGHEWETTFSNFKNGNCRCCYCYGNKKHDYEYVKNFIESTGYELLSSEYVGAHEKMLVKCPKGHKYDVSFNVFREGHGCPYCYEERKGDTLRLSYDFIKKEIEKEGYELLSLEYKNTHTPLEIKCPKGHVTNTMTYGNFKQGARCSKCNNSKGERRIINYLENNDIKYVYEKTFKGLLGVERGLLSYDFYLSDYNLLIEYQGEQHEKSVEYFGGDERFNIQQEHDKRKREYAENNNIDLLEIWYWDFDNIEEILEDILK